MHVHAPKAYIPLGKHKLIVHLAIVLDHTQLLGPKY